jgi:hypothetical protein
LLVAVLALSGTSCGRHGVAVYPVEGKVFYQGKPAVRAVVFFHPHGTAPGPDVLRPQGVVREDGSFRLSTYTPDDGAPEGEYDVTFVWTKPSPQGGDNDVALLPPRYMYPGTSGIKAQVQAGPNQLPAYQLSR